MRSGRASHSPRKPHLALLDEPRHRTDGVFDRHRRIDPVLVVEIDDVDPEPLQARVARLKDVRGAAVDAIGPARLPGLAEFAGDQHLIAAALQCPAEKLFVLTPAIHVGAVEMVDAEFNRTVDQRDPGRVVALAVNPRQRHAAETDR